MPAFPVHVQTVQLGFDGRATWWIRCQPERATNFFKRAPEMLGPNVDVERARRKLAPDTAVAERAGAAPCCGGGLLGS
jgi:hypothetical protein